MKFCSVCGHGVSLSIPPGDNRERFVCTSCGTVHYQNPRNVVGTVPVWDDKVLLCRRAIEPRYGYWTLPAGFMENDETAAQAALRETLEESGARIELGAETLDVSLFREAEIPWPQIAFRTVGTTLKRWLEDRAKGSFSFHAEDI